jgi:sugar phosphate isomerase/epimerase
VGYHNHAQEFIASFDGQTAYERFIALTEDRVAIELDLFWALTGGQDVPALVAAPRRPAHRAAHQGRRTAGEQPVRARRTEVRVGQPRPAPRRRRDVPLAESLRAATSLEYAVIEYDHAPGDVSFEDIAASYAFLTDGGYVR